MTTRSALAKVILALAEVFSVAFTEPKLKAYMDALEDLTIEEIKSAYDYFTKESEDRFMPLPAAIRKAARPQLSSKQQAIRILDHIEEAIGKFGYTNSAEARIKLGDQCWEVVGRLGGWRVLCSGNKLKDYNGYAQVRDQVEAIVYSQRQGLDYLALPEAETEIKIIQNCKVDQIIKRGLKGKGME